MLTLSPDRSRALPRTLTAHGNVYYRRPKAAITPPSVDDDGDGGTDDEVALPDWAMLSWELLY